jgi:hypothetical protein
MIGFEPEKILIFGRWRSPLTPNPESAGPMARIKRSFGSLPETTNPEISMSEPVPTMERDEMLPSFPSAPNDGGTDSMLKTAPALVALPTLFETTTQ